MTKNNDEPFNPGKGDLSKLEEVKAQHDMTLAAHRQPAVSKRHA